MNIRKALPEIIAVCVVVGITLSLILAQILSQPEVGFFDARFSGHAKPK
jgi:hypothetical protein